MTQGRDGTGGAKIVNVLVIGNSLFCYCKLSLPSRTSSLWSLTNTQVRRIPCRGLWLEYKILCREVVGNGMARLRGALNPGGKGRGFPRSLRGPWGAPECVGACERRRLVWQSREGEVAEGRGLHTVRGLIRPTQSCFLTGCLRGKAKIPRVSQFFLSSFDSSDGAAHCHLSSWDESDFSEPFACFKQPARRRT